jgi:hypothetical protein
VAIPEGVPRRTVSAGLGLVTPGGTPYQGRITFTGPNLVTVGPLELVLGGGQPLYLVDGAGTIELDLHGPGRLHQRTRLDPLPRRTVRDRAAATR